MPAHKSDRSICLLTCRDLAGFVVDDSLLIDELKSRGWNVTSLPWDTDTAWHLYDVVVVRTTWDYTHRLDEFLKTIGHIASQTQLFNSPGLIKWNSHKSYLQDLNAKGVQVVPSVMLQDTISLSDVRTQLQQWGVSHGIIKPLVSANADNTFLLDSNSPAIWPILQINQVLKAREMMLQPFLESVQDPGEYSLHYFGCKYSHAVLKTPKHGDFRVQEEHGGHIQPTNPPPELLTLASKVLSCLPEAPLYARLDFVAERSSGWCLMEAELIEPSCYFRMDARSPSRFVDALEHLDHSRVE